MAKARSKGKKKGKQAKLSKGKRKGATKKVTKARGKSVAKKKTAPKKKAKTKAKATRKAPRVSRVEPTYSVTEETSAREMATGMPEVSEPAVTEPVERMDMGGSGGNEFGDSSSTQEENSSNTM